MKKLRHCLLAWYILFFYKHFPENASALDIEGVTPYPKESGKQPTLDDLLPSISSLPSLDLPHDIYSKTTLGTDADNQESKVLVNSTESSLPTTPDTPEHEAASEQKGEAPAQDPEWDGPCCCLQTAECCNATAWNIFLILKELQLLYFVSVDNTRKEITWSTYPVVFSNHCLMAQSMFRSWMLSKITRSIEKLMQKQLGHRQNVKFWNSHLPTSAPECTYKGTVPEQWHSDDF